MMRAVSWIRAARKDFDKFPQDVRDHMVATLREVCEGGGTSNIKPLRHLGPGVFEISLTYRTDAYRVIYSLKIDDDLWVVHAFKKKSHSGISTPKPDIDLVRDRIKRLRRHLGG